MIDSLAVAIKPCLAAFDEARIRFVKYLDASGCSPNTVRAYGHDLTHLRSFLAEQTLDWFELTPTRAVDLLIHRREKQSCRRGSAQHPSLATMDGKPVVARLSGATIIRVLSAVSSFYEWAKITEQFNGPNPIIRIEDRAAAHVSERRLPFLAGIVSRPPTRGHLRPRQVHRLPRPMANDQVEALIA